MLERLHADKVSEQGARSSVVNGPFTGSKERRSFKPKVASSILVGRIPQGSRGDRVLPMLEPNARLAGRTAFRALPGDSEAFRRVVVTFWSHFSWANRVSAMAEDAKAKARKAARKAQADFERSYKRHEQVREARRKAFEEAQAAGLSTREIGDAAGLHFTRVAQVLRQKS